MNYVGEIPVAARSKAWVCGSLLAGIAVRIWPMAWIFVFVNVGCYSGRIFEG